MADQDRPRPSATMFEDISVFLGKGGGSFLMGFNPDSAEWTAALIFGEEPGSPMAAGAAYGLNKVPALAVEQCLREAGI